MTDAPDRPCPDGNHVLEGPNRKWGTCKRCGWFVNLGADED